VPHSKPLLIAVAFSISLSAMASPTRAGVNPKKIGAATQLASFPFHVDSDAILCYRVNNIFEIARAMFRYAHFTPVGSEGTPDMIEPWLDNVRALARQHV
jgi:hypothetical protein